MNRTMFGIGRIRQLSLAGVAGPRSQALGAATLGRRVSIAQKHSCSHSGCCAPPLSTGSGPAGAVAGGGNGGNGTASFHSSSAAARPHTSSDAHAPQQPHPAIAELMANNREYVARKTKDDPEFFSRHAGHQKPKFFVVGCGDSRVPLEKVFGLGYGEMFVHRNVGNLVCSGDLNVLSALHFAVEVLEVEHIVVCGHYGCGAVSAATQPRDLGMVENWLRNIRDVHRLHDEELTALDDEVAPGQLWSERHRRLVELSVKEQCINLFKVGVVQKALARREGFPRIHGLVYGLEDGQITHIPLNLSNYFDKYRHIYKLMQGPGWGTPDE